MKNEAELPVLLLLKPYVWQHQLYIVFPSHAPFTSTRYTFLCALSLAIASAVTKENEGWIVPPLTYLPRYLNQKPDVY